MACTVLHIFHSGNAVNINESQVPIKQSSFLVREESADVLQRLQCKRLVSEKQHPADQGDYLALMLRCCDEVTMFLTSYCCC
jgi:hypothetical protein